MHHESFRRWVARSSLLLCALVVPAAANAADPALSATSDGDTLKRAREQFAQALALQTAGDWAGALTLLKEVAALKPTPQVRFNIALCEERLGRLVAALGDYQLAGSDAQAQKAEQVQKEVDARLESVKARLPRVIVQRGRGAEAATISLDGVTLGDSVVNVALPADPGPHSVEAALRGHKPFRQSFRVAEHQTQTIQVELEPEPEPVVRELGLPAAPETITSPGLRSAGYVVGGAGIASLIASGAMFYLRQTAVDDLDRQCGQNRSSCPDSAKNTADRGKLYTTLGNVTLGVGAAALGVGALFVIVGGHPKQRDKLGLAPGALDANVGGASIVGNF